jgi:hypothetical protein
MPNGIKISARAASPVPALRGQRELLADEFEVAWLGAVV